MSTTAIFVMTLALMFYTFGVWTEKIQRRLTLFHLILFLLGLLFDTIGTGIMFQVTEGMSFNFHSFF